MLYVLDCSDPIFLAVKRELWSIGKGDFLIGCPSPLVITIHYARWGTESCPTHDVNYLFPMAKDYLDDECIGKPNCTFSSSTYDVLGNLCPGSAELKLLEVRYSCQLGKFISEGGPEYTETLHT